MRIRIAASLALIAMALGACGEDSKKLPKAEVVKEANAVCTKYKKKIRAIARPTETGAGPEALTALGEYFDKVLPVTEDLHDELGNLEPEDEDLKKKWNTYLDEQQSGIDQVREVSEKAKDGDRKAVEAGLRDSDGPDAQPIFGQKECGD